MSDTPENNNNPAGDQPAAPAQGGGDTAASSESVAPSADEEAVLSGVEMIDREERKRLKEEEKKKRKAKKLDPTEKEIEEALASGRMAEEKKERNKRIFRYSILGFVFFLFFFAYDYLFSSYEGGMTFGICKNYLELNVRFPQELKYSTVDDLGSSVRIWYTQVDAFGEYRLESIQCYFRADETYGAAIDRITINRREVPTYKVDAYNAIMPVVLTAPIDLSIPYPLPDSLEGLQFDANIFRKPIFD